MKLGEAIQKRSYYEKCLADITDLILQASVASDKYTHKENEYRVSLLLDRFQETYDELMKYNLLVKRSKNEAMIPIDDGEVSVSDAEAIRDIMSIRYKYFRDILNHLMKSNGNSCVDMEKISDVLMDYHNTLHSIDIRIENAKWEDKE